MSLASSVARSVARPIASSLVGSETVRSVLAWSLKEAPYYGSFVDGLAYLTSFENEPFYPMLCHAACGTFDGVDDYASVSLDLTGTNKVSIAFWLYRPSWTNDDKLAFEFSVNTGSATTGFYFDPNHVSGGMQIAMLGNVGYASAEYARPSAAAWHHYVVVFDKSLATNECDLYIDGILATPTGRTFNSNNTNNFGNHTLYVGSRAGSALFNAMRMSHLQIFSKRLTDDEVTFVHTSGLAGTDPTAANLKLSWTFEENQGTDLWDVSGNAVHGMIAGATTTLGAGFWANSIPGHVAPHEINYGGEINGSGGYVPALDGVLTYSGELLNYDEQGLNYTLLANGNALDFGPGKFKSVGLKLIIDPGSIAEMADRDIPATFVYGDDLDDVTPSGTASFQDDNGYHSVKILVAPDA